MRGQSTATHRQHHTLAFLQTRCGSASPLHLSGTGNWHAQRGRGPWRERTQIAAQNPRRVSNARQTRENAQSLYGGASPNHAVETEPHRQTEAIKAPPDWPTGARLKPHRVAGTRPDRSGCNQPHSGSPGRSRGTGRASSRATSRSLRHAATRASQLPEAPKRMPQAGCPTLFQRAAARTRRNAAAPHQGTSLSSPSRLLYQKTAHAPSVRTSSNASDHATRAARRPMACAPLAARPDSEPATPRPPP